MARDLSKPVPSTRFPVIPLCLAAAILSSMGAITHSGRILGIQKDEGFVYNMVRRNPYRKYSFLDKTPTFNRSKYTFDSFVVAGGIDLAGFGLDDEVKRTNEYFENIAYFELFEDFDLSQNIRGDETWIELLEYRRDATHPSLSFYVDKVAFKEWLLTSYSQIKIAGPKSYFLKYASELYRDVESVRQAQNAPLSSKGNLLTEELLKWLPTDLDYAAKPTHLSCSGGVWLVHNDLETNTTYVGNGKKKMKVANPKSTVTDVRKEIAEDLSQNLQKVQEKCGRTVIESYALRHVRPGIVVEERFTQPTIAVENTKDDEDEDNDDENEDEDNDDENEDEDEDNNDEDIDDEDNDAFLMGGMESKDSDEDNDAFLMGGMESKDSDEDNDAFLKGGMESKDTDEDNDASLKGGMELKDNDEDNDAFLKGGMEFKVFTIWGKAWLTVWRPGTDGVKALFFRNGTNLVFDPPIKNKETKPPPFSAPEIHKLPEWLEWDKVINIAETLGRNKDMFRTDIFVGVAVSGKSSDEETIRYVVSETEIHPTPLRGFETVFEEAGRLWLAGYYYLFAAKSRSSRAFKVIPNTEVPRTFSTRDGR